MLVPILLAAMPVNAEAAIIAFGVAYTALATVLQRKLSNPKRVRELQEKINVHSKELNAMMKANAPKEELMKKQGEMMPLMKESMMQNMKATFVLIPTFLVVYYLLVPYLFGYLKTDTAALFGGITVQYKGLFFVTVFVLGIITSITILVYDRRKAKAERQALAAAEAEIRSQ